MSIISAADAGYPHWGMPDPTMMAQLQQAQLGGQYMGPTQGQVAAAAKLDSENITLDIRKVNNGYLVSSRHGTFIAANADEVKDAVMQIMVKAKLNDAA